MFLALLWCIYGADPVLDKPGSVYLPSIYLVRTTTVKVWREPKEGFERGRLRVTQVLAGPDRLRGLEFEATTEHQSHLIGSVRHIKLYPDTEIDQFKKDAEGLWWVTEAKDQTPSSMLDGEIVHDLGLQHFPYQNTKTKPFFDDSSRPLMKQEELWKEGEEFAKAVIEVYAAKTDEDRRVLLERYAATEVTPIAGWAMGMLASGPRKSAIKVLRGLVKKVKLEATSQVMLDELLCRLDTEWFSSTDRKQLLTRWLEVNADYTLFKKGCHRIRYATELDELDANIYAEVVGPAVMHSDQLSKGQVAHLHNVVWTARFPGQDFGEAFAKAVTEVYAAKTVEARRALLERYATTEESPVAGWAMGLLALDPKEPTIKFLRGLIKKEKLEATSQMRLDELLCRLDSKEWSGSKERKELLARWLDAKVDDILFREACLRLRDARGVDLDAKLFVEVVSAAVSQADQMNDAKLIRLGDVLRFSGAWFSEADKKMGREFLERMKNTAKSESLKRDISDGLKQFPQP